LGAIAPARPPRGRQATGGRGGGHGAYDPRSRPVPWWHTVCA